MRGRFLGYVYYIHPQIILKWTKYCIKVSYIMICISCQHFLYHVYSYVHIYAHIRSLIIERICYFKVCDYFVTLNLIYKYSPLAANVYFPSDNFCVELILSLFRGVKVHIMYICTFILIFCARQIKHGFSFILVYCQDIQENDLQIGEPGYYPPIPLLAKGRLPDLS